MRTMWCDIIWIYVECCGYLAVSVAGSFMHQNITFRTYLLF